MPLAGVVLRTEDGGGHLIPGLYQFQHIPGLCLLEGVEQPLVQNKQLLFSELFHVVSVGSVSPGHRDLYQQIRQADIPDGIIAAAGSHTKGTGQVGFSCPGGAQNDDIVCFLEVDAEGQAQDLLPGQHALRQVLGILCTSGRVRVASVADKPGQTVTFSGTPFRIHQHGKPVLKENDLD